MDAVKLEEFAEVGSDLFLDVTVPPVGGQAIRAVLVPVESDVVWAFELNDVFSFRLIVDVAPRAAVLNEANAQLVTGGAQGVDVFNLCLDRCEVTHKVLGIGNEAQITSAAGSSFHSACRCPAPRSLGHTHCDGSPTDTQGSVRVLCV
jgi:hypothetical protein